MIKRTVSFSRPCRLSLKDCQMVIGMKDDPDFHRTIPVEDIGMVLLENQQISITMPLLNALADNNAAVIVCADTMMPNAMMLNLNSNSVQGERYRCQINASEPLKKNLWKQTVESKIRNQAALLDKLDKDGSVLKPYWQNVKSDDSDNREGTAAKIYWNALFGKEFTRLRTGDSPNEMLNYGYTILRAAVARALMGSGLFPAFGIHHRNRYNAFPLADDIMEPYRPFVDEIVFDLYANGERELTKDVKTEILKLLYVDTMFDKVSRPLEIGLSMTTASLFKCFAGEQKRVIYPLLL